MSIMWVCPQCGHGGEVADEHGGKVGKCVKCGERIRVPDRVAPPPVIEATPEPANSEDGATIPPPPRQSNATISWSMIAGLSGAIFLATLHTESPFWNYLPLMLLVFSIGMLIWLRFRRPSVQYAAIAATILAPIIFFQFDWAVRSWSKTDEEGVTQLFTDKFWRRGEVDFEREVRWEDPDLGYYTAHMTFSPSHKLHGEYYTTYWGGDEEKMELYAAIHGFDKATFLYSKRTWYWYGEEVSEGDWHLRNKR